MKLLTNVAAGLCAIWITMLSAMIFMLVSTCFSHCAHADIFELQELNVDFIHMFPGGVDPLLTENANLPNRTIGNRLEANFDTSVFNILYWNSRVHSATDANVYEDGHTDGGQFRMVGLEMHLGVNISDELQFGYYHHSQHSLDGTYSGGPFPREDGLELKVILFRGKNKPGSIF